MKKLAVMACLAAALSASAEVIIGNGDRIAFLGDSITANGNRPAGYVNMVMKGLEVVGVKDAVKIPAGVSGHKSNNMRGRLQRDVIDKHPQWMTFSCGVNDVWHEFMNGNGVNAEKYALVYRLLLDEIKSELPETKLVILEPFVLNGTATCNTGEYPERYETFRREIKLRSEAAFDVCQSHGGTFVPLQGVLDTACEKAPAGHWLIDGVHPTAAGHELIAREWIKTVKL